MGKEPRWIPTETREQLLREFTHCIFCGSVDRLELDHKIPFSRGGTNDIENLQVACRSCNRAKAARSGADPWDFICSHLAPLENDEIRALMEIVLNRKRSKYGTRT